MKKLKDYLQNKAKECKNHSGMKVSGWLTDEEMCPHCKERYVIESIAEMIDHLSDTIEKLEDSIKKLKN